MTRGGKRGKLKQRVSPSSHRAWKSGRPRRIPTFPQRRRRLLHRHNFQTTPQQFQHFVRDLKETFWGDLYGKTRLAWKEFLEEQSRRSSGILCVNRSPLGEGMKAPAILHRLGHVSQAAIG